MSALPRRLVMGVTALALVFLVLSGSRPTPGAPGSVLKDGDPPSASGRLSVKPEQIAAWIKELGDESFAVREQAGKALVEAGRSALEALTEALKDPDPEIRRRAAEVAERIEINAALAPTRITLALRDVPVPEAVAALGKQSRIKLELIPQQGPARQQLEQKKISLSLDDVPFWEALERLCKATGLTYASQGPRTLLLQQGEGAPPRVPTAASGPFRLRVTALNYYRNLNLAGPPTGVPGRTEQLTMQMDVLAEPHITVLGIGSPQLTEARDDNGESLLSDVGPRSDFRNQYVGPGMLQALPIQATLRPPSRPNAALQVLKGTLPIEAVTRRVPLVQVDDVATARGKVIKGEGKLLLVILQMQDQGGRNGSMRFVLSGLEKEALPPNYSADMFYRPRFELTDADGRPYNLGMNFNNLGDRNQGDMLEGNFYYSSNGDVGPAATFTYYGVKQVRASVAFELRDVPLP
jgi:hypothetical protein